MALTLKDFKPVAGWGYLSFKDHRIEICLETCMNGFDVAIYDHKQNLLTPKFCTNIPGTINHQKAIELAIERANRIYDEFNIKHQEVQADKESPGRIRGSNI